MTKRLKQLTKQVKLLQSKVDKNAANVKRILRILKNQTRGKSKPKRSN